MHDNISNYSITLFAGLQVSSQYSPESRDVTVQVTWVVSRSNGKDNIHLYQTSTENTLWQACLQIVRINRNTRICSFWSFFYVKYYLHLDKIVQHNFWILLKNCQQDHQPKGSWQYQKQAWYPLCLKLR